jgi:hypothetical protein
MATGSPSSSRSPSRSSPRSPAIRLRQADDGVVWDPVQLATAMDKIYVAFMAKQVRIGISPCSIPDLTTGVTSDDNRQQRCVAYCHALLNPVPGSPPEADVLRLAMVDAYDKIHNKSGTYSLPLYPATCHCDSAS